MDPTDARLLDRLQQGLPLEPQPFRAVAADLGLTEAEVLTRTAGLLHQGVIRRLGAGFEPQRLGYSSTLVAARVPAEQVDAAAAAINAHPEVTHNYERDHEVNIWFTLIAPGRETLQRLLNAIRTETGLGELHDLPALRRYKVDARFPVGKSPRPVGARFTAPTAAQPPLDERARRVIHALQEDLAVVERPFLPLSEQAGLAEAEFVAALAELAAAGVLRKLGAFVRPLGVGLRASAMVVWRVADDAIEAAGARFAAQPEVSHCYERPPFAGFTYTLYTMVHAPTDEECSALVEHMSGAARLRDLAILRTVRELKRSTPRYRV